MTDEPNDLPSDTSQGQPPKSPQYHDIPSDQLKLILEEHKKWVESEGKEGTSADLISANLRQADLRTANLQLADLRSANLQQANLRQANLEKANLQGKLKRRSSLAEKRAGRGH